MKKIHDYNVPESWNEITIKQQLEAETLVKEYPEYGVLANISGHYSIPLSELKKAPFSLTNQLKKEYTGATSFTRTPIPDNPISEFKYKGETYSVVPTLLQQETQDFVTITSVSDKPDALLYIIAVLAKKKINGRFESLSDYSVEERANHFVDLPLPIAFRIHAFFLTSAKLYQQDYGQLLDQFNTNINGSILSMISTLKKQSGGGLFTRFAAVTLQTYLWFLKRHWSKQYSGYKSHPEKTNWTTRFKKLYKRKQTKR